jgi:Copper transport outer membrane protein, MctB
MINFRFHLASLIAIFLALALGVVVGAGVIDRGVVDTLNSRLDSVERRSARIQSENGDLRDENGELADALKAEQCHAVGDRLVTSDVAILAVRGVSEDIVNQTAQAAGHNCAAANVDGVLWLQGKWALSNADDVKQMADLLGLASRRAATVRAAAWKQIAQRMEGGSTATDGSTDLLAAMRDAGFVQFDARDSGATIEQFPSRGAATLLVVGTEGDVPEQDVVVAGATALHDAGIPLVVGDVYVKVPDGPGRSDVFAHLRDNAVLDKSVSTVDNLDRPQGPVTAVLALVGLEQDPPVVGHYGIHGDALLPDVQ